jgi:hypothetical protein
VPRPRASRLTWARRNTEDLANLIRFCLIRVRELVNRCGFRKTKRQLLLRGKKNKPLFDYSNTNDPYVLKIDLKSITDF